MNLMEQKRKARRRRTHPPARSALTLEVTAAAGKCHAAFVRRQLSRAAALIRSPLHELSVALVGDQTMSRLHLQFMNLPGPTDVLSFPLETDGRGRVTAGELVICVPEAQRQARRHRIRMDHELLLYAVHGLLHLSGYDDHSENDFRKMHRKEDTILTELGIGRVFAPAGESTRERSRPRNGRRTAGGGRR